MADRTESRIAGVPGSLEELQRELAGALVPSSVEELQRQFAAALEQQAATARILEVVNRSGGDLEPVYEAVLGAAQRLLLADSAVLHRVVDGALEVVALGQGMGLPGRGVGDRTPIDRETVAGHAALERRAIHIPDASKEPQLPQHAPWTRLGVPIVRGDELVGVITVAHVEARPFTAREIGLLETFAGQVGLAIENADLLNETREGLERQTAIAEILRAISGSPTDVQPVLDAIADSARRFCGAEDASVILLREDHLEAIAHSGQLGVAIENPQAPVPLAIPLEGSVGGRAIRERRIVHVADIFADPDAYPHTVERSRAFGARAYLGAPLVREGDALGLILLRRSSPGQFAPKQIDLLTTFADQAVIAMENVRLFNETKEALEQQTALSEILRSISDSPSDVTPVFEAIARGAIRYCGAEDANVAITRGDRYEFLAHEGPVPTGPLPVAFPISAGLPGARAIRERRVVHEEDVSSAVDQYWDVAGAKPALRTVLAVPMLRGDVCVGAIVMRRLRVQPFTDRQIALAHAFADQAAIAIENVRLFKETNEALERQTAVSEILRVMSSSPSDVQPVLDAIAESAMRFCLAEHAIVNLTDGSMITPVAGHLSVPEPFPLDRTTVTGRSMIDVTTLSIRDLADPAHADTFPLGHAQALRSGERAMVATPMIRDGRAVGGIVLWRTEPSEFTERQVELLETFADQAAIAIENVRLFNETKEALEQQAATARVLQVISRSAFDLRSALETLVEEAARLCAADHGSIHRWDGSAYRTAAFWGPSLSEEYKREGFESPRYPGRDTLVGRTAFERDVIHILDATTDPEYKVQSLQKLGGYRTMLGVPLLRDGFPIGVFALMRGEVHPFTDRQIELVRTFADQAAIAIENVRLFNETKEALEQQTAISEILRVISRSPFQLDPVFETVIERAVSLTAADWGLIFRPEGERLHLVAASTGAPREFIEYLQRAGVPLDRGSASGRAALERRTIHIPDVLTDAEYQLGDVVTRLAGNRTLLAVPMLRGGSVVGVLAVDRNEVTPYTEREITLIETFADQAAIAIENVRLFNEIQSKSKQLEVASRHKSEFLANMSHELRTPLNAIIGFTDVMLEEMFGPLNDKQKEYLEDVRNSGTHLLTLINDILDLSKIEAGRIDLEIAEFSFPDALENALTLVRERATRHGISLAADVSGDVGRINADERKVKQVLVNLLANAVKFTPEGGRVTVKARRLNGEIEVAVHDTGIGVATDDQERIFDEFQQVGRDPERSREGTGLGLTLAKRFVELHGGRIWIESEVGKGSTFTFAIPVRQTAVTVAKA